MAGARKKPSKKGGNFQGYYTDHTGRRVYFTGTPNRTETKKIAQQLEAKHRQIALGVEPPPTAPAKHRKRPFLEVVDEYVGWGRTFGRKDGKGWSPDWANRTNGYLRKWAETLSIETLADLDGVLPRVEATLQQLTEQGYSGRGIAGTVKPLRTFCSWCIGHGYLRENPLKGLARIDETPQSERRALTIDEIQKLFSVAPDWRRLAYAVALTTGLRLGELRKLDRTDLETENSRLRLRWRQTKSRKAAYCYLPSDLVKAVAAFADSGAPGRLYQKTHTRRALPETPLLFIPTHLLRIFDRDLARVGIPKHTHEGRLDIHGLRVAAISLGAEAGASVKELQTLARHADPKLTFGVYAKSRDSRMAELAEQIGGALPGVKSATEVQSGGEPDNWEGRKSLPDMALSSADNEKGLCCISTGPGVDVHRMQKSSAIRVEATCSSVSAGGIEIPVVDPLADHFATRQIVLVGGLVEDPYATAGGGIAHNNRIGQRAVCVLGEYQFNGPIACKRIQMERAVGCKGLQRRCEFLALGRHGNGSIVPAGNGHTGNIHDCLQACGTICSSIIDNVEYPVAGVDNGIAGIQEFLDD